MLASQGLPDQREYRTLPFTAFDPSGRVWREKRFRSHPWEPARRQREPFLPYKCISPPGWVSKAFLEGLEQCFLIFSEGSQVPLKV